MQTVTSRNHSTTRPAVQSAPAFDPMLLWVAFRHHWLWTIPLGLVLACAAAWFVWSSFVPQYEASHLLEVNRDYIVFRGLEDGVRDYARSEKQLILNALVLGEVLENPELRSAPSLSDPQTAEKELRKRLIIHNGGTENYLIIAYRDSDRQAAANVCNAVTESYLRVREASSEKRMADIVQLLQPAINEWKKIVETKRHNISEMSRVSLGADPFKPMAISDVNAEKLIELRGLLAGLSADQAVAEAQLKVLKSSKVEPGKPSPADIATVLDNDKEVIKVRTKLQDRLGSLRELERRELQVINKARYERLKMEADALEHELTQVEAKAKASAVSVLAKAAAENAQAERVEQIAKFEAQIESVKAKHELYSAEYNTERARIEKMGGETADLFFVKEDYERASEMHDRLSDRMDMLKTEQRRTNGIFSVSAALPPSFPVEEAPYKKIGMFALASMLLPFCLAVLIEFRNKRIVTANGALTVSNLPVVGEIARITGGTGYGKPSRLFEESIDALAASVLMKSDSARTIAVTSAMPAEGKSSVAAQLAISLAKISKQPVLIIDADVRLPSLHSMFQVGFTPGLAKVIRGQATLEEAINRDFSKLVHVLPAGKLNCNPHELLSHKNVSEFLASLPQEYRYVVIDTAPVLPAAETLSITSCADATLLCAMRDVSRTDHINRAQLRLETAGSRTLGVVFNGVTPTEYAYRYGDYSYARAGQSS